MKRILVIAVLAASFGVGGAPALGGDQGEDTSASSCQSEENNGQSQSDGGDASTLSEVLTFVAETAQAALDFLGVEQTHHQDGHSTSDFATSDQQFSGEFADDPGGNGFDE